MACEYENEFQCRNEIYSVDFNLNGKRAWKANISAETIVKFKMTYFSISNYTYIEGYIQAGAFSLSQTSLEGINIDKIVDEEHYWEKWKKMVLELKPFQIYIP